MSMEQSDRATLLAVVGRELGREVSARMVMFHQAIAERLGLNATDHKALDLLSRAGPITAGELAELTGLTTGAITGIIDRLEKAGFVRREHDPKDRRRVIIRPLMEKMHHDIAPLFDSMGQATDELCSRYSDQELILIRDFMSRIIVILQEETAKLRMQTIPTREPPGLDTAARSL
jgi:DNA-binding MarR family transcriptional regulator